ncbi:MAG: hypothetical protein VYC19_11445 [Pseudomonadota bacterium]|jgi:hypothetical protein|nr:hypothetical protein [Pseudomonadota bacterium]MEC7703356.1 hypothetical protein [Pseudomonadota bacterium]MEC9236478.1 hypothetical protein [Pseudomonadota bacterium]MEE3323609.1 hypothetical protein [Pseudomonadota bacterium]
MDAALMNVELGRLPDGGIVLCANPEFPEQVKRVEYYRDQKLFMLIYEDIDHEGELMHYEMQDDVDEVVRHAPGLTLVACNPRTMAPYGYKVPLVQVGV